MRFVNFSESISLEFEDCLVLERTPPSSSFLTDEDCAPRRHSWHAFWLIYYVSTLRTNPLFAPSLAAMFRQSHPGPCYPPRINLVAWRGQISSLMSVIRIVRSFVKIFMLDVWLAWKKIVKIYEIWKVFRYSCCWINMLNKKIEKRYFLS